MTSVSSAISTPRLVRAPRGTDLSCKGWQQEAALRMLMNNLDPEVAEHPEDLVVYGGTGRVPGEAMQEAPFALIKGKGPAIGKVIQWAKKVAATDTPVLLIGESGVGKEQLAQIIHQSSSRRVQPFYTVHCGIVPAGMLESELFGYQGGAFKRKRKWATGQIGIGQRGYTIY